MNQAEVMLRRNIVGQQLKQWRESAGLSQSDVAKRLKYSSSQFISNWERGLAMPPMEVLPKLMGFYGTSAAEMTEVIHRYQEQHLGMQYSMLVDLLSADQ